MSAATQHRKLAAIMFTDMVGYSALSQRNEALALELLEEHRGVVRDLLPRHGGREVKTTGDGFLIEFPSALAAVQCATAVQAALHTRNLAQPEKRQVLIRIGIHVGDVVVRDGDVHGDAVNIAARIEPLAVPGGICISEDVARLIRNKVEHSLVALGPAELKHISLPVVISRIVLPWEAPAPFAARGLERHWRRVASVVAVAVLALALFATRNKWAGPRSSEFPSVAVVPFEQQGADAESAGVPQVLAGALADTLGRLRGLKSFSGVVFEGRKDRLQVAREYGIQHLVLGTVTKLGPQLQFRVELVHTEDGSQQWSTNYDYDTRTENLLSLQSRLARTIAVEVAGRLSPADAQRLARRDTTNAAAYDAYYLGRFHWLRSGDTGYSNALVCFSNAIALDPNYALAYAGLSDSYAAATGMLLPPVEGLPKAKEAAIKALELQPDLPDAHVALGMTILFDEWDWTKAEHHLTRAIELAPDLAQARDAYGCFLFAAGRFDESLTQGLEAVRLNPVAPSYRVDLAGPYIARHDLTNALAQLRKALDFDGSNPMVHLVIGSTYMANRRFAEAEKSFREALRLQPDEPLNLGGLGASLAAQGRSAEARKLVGRLDDLEKKRYVPAIQAAYVFAHLGENDQAFARLERAFRQKDNGMPWLKVDPMLIPLRSDPRFEALTKRIRRPP